jgi:hypothetical protein
MTTIHGEKEKKLSADDILKMSGVPKSTPEPHPSSLPGSDEEKRIRIAEACGFTNIGEHFGMLVGDHPKNKTKAISVPNYLSDLNACHEAEKSSGFHDRSKPELRARWCQNLRRVIAPDCPQNKAGTALVSDADLLTATARQRALAFLAAIEREKA